MGEQMANRDVFPGGRRVRKVLVNSVVEANFSFFDEHHDGGGGELLAHGPGLEDRLGLHGHAELNIRHSIAAGLYDFSVMNYSERHARDVLRTQLGGDKFVRGCGEWFVGNGMS